MNLPARHPRTLNSSLAVAVSSAMLSACGGGGGATTAGGGSDVVAITSAANDAPMYGKRLTLTVNGSNVDKLVVTATGGCKDVVLGSGSSASTALYQCTLSAVGPAQIFLKRPDGVVSTVSFTVPMPQVTMNFSNGAGIQGDVVVTLAPDKTPLTVDNFLKYVNAGFYKDTRIHRVVPGAIVQGGGYGEAISGSATTANIPGLKPTTGTIVLEVNKGLSNKQWTIAMARADAPNTANSQFYFNLADNIGLDPSAASAGYAVFGSITAGTTNVAAIANPAIAACVSITFFTTAPECTPIPNVVLTSATQTQ